MKLFWMKNKVLLTTLLAVLVLGVCFWGGLRFFEGKAMEDAFFRTSFAETEATSTPIPGEMPVPTAAPTELPAELVAEDILNTEWKYKDIFPRITNIYSFQAKTWKEGDKVADSLAVEAITRAGEVYEQLLHRKLDLYQFNVTRYVDEKGYRPNILRITGEKNDFVCVLRESDLSLLVADNGQIAASEWMDAKKDAATVAEFLGTEAKANDMDRGGSSRNGEWIERSLAYELGDGRWITLAYNRNTLNGIQVHEDERCMEESVCFLADITMNPEVVHLVAEENFEQGDIHNIAEGDMSVDQVTAFYRKFLSAANGRASERRDAEGKSMEELDYNLKEWEITYFLDKSGYRENFYRIHKDGLIDMDIAAKSGYIVRATCQELYNPDDGLKLIDIDYDHMGGPEYEAYMRHVIDTVFGPDSYDFIGVNAVYDGNYCTMDADMKDGCTYEFGFTGGRLMYVEHYLYGLEGIPGWFADNLYVNTITGEEFYQAY